MFGKHLWKSDILSKDAVSSLLVFSWIEAKWNSKRYGFHIGHFDRNEISNRYEIFIWTYLPKMKWVSTDSLDVAFNAHVRLLTQCGYGFHIGHFDRNKISFRVIKYYVNTTQNEMPTHVHQDIGSFWNTAEMKLDVNRTWFDAGLKSQTCMSSFHLSCKRTLTQTCHVLNSVCAVTYVTQAPKQKRFPVL